MPLSSIVPSSFQVSTATSQRGQCNCVQVCHGSSFLGLTSLSLLPMRADHVFRCVYLLSKFLERGFIFILLTPWGFLFLSLLQFAVTWAKATLLCVVWTEVSMSSLLMNPGCLEPTPVQHQSDLETSSFDHRLRSLKKHPQNQPKRGCLLAFWSDKLLRGSHLLRQSQSRRLLSPGFPAMERATAT